MRDAIIRSMRRATMLGRERGTRAADRMERSEDAGGDTLQGVGRRLRS